MTDIEKERIKAICKVAGVKEIDDLSDGFHTFKQLYYQRMILFATIVKQNKNKAWKSLRHEDGKLCFGGGWFIVGIDTPEGSYTYHYEIDYYDLFDCEELEYSKHWDGHTEKDVVRLLSLPCTNWNLTSVGPPKDFETVFVQSEYGEFDICTYIPPRIKPKLHPDGFWGDTDCCDFDYFDIVAWMPLPEPYESEEYN